MIWLCDNEIGVSGVRGKGNYVATIKRVLELNYLM